MEMKNIICKVSLIVAFFGLPSTFWAKELKVMTSFTVLADVVKQVGGKHVKVISLVGLNGDPHKYEPSVKDAKNLKNADLAFISGHGLEGWFGRLAKAAGGKKPILVGKGIHTRQFKSEGKLMIDPHVWNDAKNVIVWVKDIVNALIKVDPEDKDYFKENARVYIKKLRDLDAYARVKMSAFPRNKRKVITSHDAFNYLGRSYGITFLAPLGISTEMEASAKDIARLIKQIRKEDVKVYFVENSNDPRLAMQIANATRAKAGGTLYPEALSNKVDTYVKMFKYNIDTIAAAFEKNL